MATTLLQRARPNAGGTITRGGVTTNYAGGPARSQLNPNYDESQDAQPRPVVRSVAAPRPAVTPARSIATRTPPNVAGLSGFARENTLANAGIYRPGSFGAANAAANGTGYTPPQQTERANPLTGDNNIPMEGVTTPVARAPFVQRGGATPGGQDVAAAVKTTETEDDNIATSMAATQSRIGGAGSFARKFGSPQSASAYDAYVRRLYPQGT